MTSVLITGTSRGIGLEFARQYATAGWQVFATCRDPARAIELQRLAQKTGENITVVPLNVTDAQSIRNAATQLRGSAIDVLINNAGIGGPAAQSVGRVDYESWARVLDVNTMGPLRVLEAFTDHIARSERKLVVTITSGMGSLADNTSGGYIPYRSSKAAVNMVMRSAAVDLAPRGITCVLVSPGWVRTDMGGSGATLTPAQSVSALRQLIEKFGPDDSGRFYSHDGREYAW